MKNDSLKRTVFLISGIVIFISLFVFAKHIPCFLKFIGLSIALVLVLISLIGHNDDIDEEEIVNLDSEDLLIDSKYDNP